MRRSQLLIPSLLAVLAAALVLSACSGSSDSGKPALTLYNGQHEQTTALLVATFESRPASRSTSAPATRPTLGNQIDAGGLELARGRVLHGEHPRAGSAAAKKSLLAPVRPSTLAAVPAATTPRRATWVGVSARDSVLVYNTSQIAPAQLPSSILELAEPRWKGKLGFAPSETDFQPLVTAIIKLDGVAAAERWLTGVKANGKIYPDNETVVAQVNNGESAFGLINHYYWYRLRDEVGKSGLHSALHYYASGDPGDLAERVRRGGAEVELPPGRRAGACWPSSSASAGQEMLAHSHSYEYPLRPGVSPAPGLPPFAQLQPALVDAGRARRRPAPRSRWSRSSDCCSQKPHRI